MIRVYLRTRSRTFTLASGKTIVRKYFTLRWQDSTAKWRSESIGLTRDSGRRSTDTDKVLTKAEAETLRYEKQQRLNDGRDLLDKPERCTVRQFIDYHEHLAGGDVEPATLVQYRNSGEHLATAIGDSVLVEQLSHTHVQRVKSHMQAAGLAPATVNKNLRTLKAMYNRAVAAKMLAVNPFSGVALPRSSRKEIREYTAEEQAAMLRVIGNDIWWESLIELAFATGFRKDELLHLMWADIDEAEKLVRVQGRRAGVFEVSGVEYPVLAFTTKSHENRTVPLPDHVLDLLQRLRLKSGGSRYLFLSLERLTQIRSLLAVDGRKRVKVDPVNNLLRRFKTIQRRARKLLAKQRGVELEQVDWAIGSLHDIRRTYGTRQARAGVPMHVLQRLMGHESITTTQRHYLGVSKGDMDAARTAAGRKIG